MTEQMTWVPSQSRWVKTHDYKQYWVSPRQLAKLYPDLTTETSREGSRAAANQWWHDTAAKLRRVSEVLPSLEELTARRGLSKKELRQFNNLLAERLEPVRQFLSGLDVPTDQLVKSQWLTPLVSAGLNNQFTAAAVETETKLSYWRDKWLTVKKAELRAGSFAPLPHHLSYFVDMVGGDTAIATITEETLERFKLHLAGLVKTQTISQVYAHNVCNATVKPFIRYLFKHRQIQLPNNLDDLHFSVITREPALIPLDTARGMLKQSEGRLRAWLLLMWNCCYYQSDLSDLQPTEVDWKKGTIRRKRSKERDEVKVPTVQYKLWTETFAAMKQWGSRTGDTVFTDGSKPLVSGRSDIVGREFAKLGLDGVLNQPEMEILGRSG